MPMSERRFQRSPLDTPVRLLIGHREVVGVSRDISLCGMFISVAAPWPPLGDTVHIEFALPESSRMASLDARIVRHQSEEPGRELHAGCGVEFIGQDGELSEIIEGYVNGRFRSLRFLKRLLDDPQTAEEHIHEFIRAFGLNLSGTRADLQAQVEERLKFFRMRPERDA